VKHELAVYNLEFPAYRNKMLISGYTFTQVENYGEALNQLQHLVPVSHEFNTPLNTGTHCATAYVSLDTAKPKSALLTWSKDGVKHDHLYDVLFMLGLFTGREVFVCPITFKGPLKSDPRQHKAGGALRAAIPYEASKNGDLERRYDMGFEKTLNRMCKLLADPNWKVQYDDGHYLFLAHQIFKSDTLELAFTGAWTLWEHLFFLITGIGCQTKLSRPKPPQLTRSRSF
jgi:hypothetical protein